MVSKYYYQGILLLALSRLPLTTPFIMGSGRRSNFFGVTSRSTTSTGLTMTEDNVVPTTFREAEVLGLRFMQQGNYQDALQAFQSGLKLPGSRNDILRTKTIPGPSLVGGSMGGTESMGKRGLDEFELQAVHYNIACAQAQLGRTEPALEALQIAFDNGFDNYATVRNDPDLEPVRNSPDFDALMEKYDPKKKGGGFNPFGFLKT